MDLIEVKVSNEDQWKKCHEGINEIPYSKESRPIFPRILYNVSGLETETMYRMSLKFMQQGTYDYVWDVERYKKFSITGDIHQSRAVFPDIIANGEVPSLTGECWMRVGVTFANIRLTTDPDSQINNVVYLFRKRKYRPIICIENETDGNKREWEFEFMDFYTSAKLHKAKAIRQRRRVKNTSSSTDGTSANRKSRTGRVHQSWQLALAQMQNSVPSPIRPFRTFPMYPAIHQHFHLFPQPMVNVNFSHPMNLAASQIHPWFMSPPVLPGIPTTIPNTHSPRATPALLPILSSTQFPILRDILSRQPSTIQTPSSAVSFHSTSPAPQTCSPMNPSIQPSVIVSKKLFSISSLLDLSDES